MLWNKLALGAVFAALFFTPVNAASYVKITVDISEQTMHVTTSSGHEEFYPVSTAGEHKITPTGKYKPYVLRKMHYSTRYNNAPMPFSIFYSGNYAIHGTTHVKQLGQPASNGCVRLHPKNAERVFNMVKAVGMDNTYITIVP